MRIKPDILVKGGDWAENEIVGSTEVKQWGGSTASIPFQFDTSTSNTIERIREG
jgi:bifunctional ADP-heptose synthase (sugar kinase/adenylyltransferase)